MARPDPSVCVSHRSIILNRFPDETLEWVAKVSKWPTTRVVACHLANDVAAGGADFARAFDYLREPPDGADDLGPISANFGGISPGQRVRATFDDMTRLRPKFGAGNARAWRRSPGATDADMRLLSTASELCTRAGLVDPPKAGNLPPGLL